MLDSQLLLQAMLFGSLLLLTTVVQTLATRHHLLASGDMAMLGGPGASEARLHGGFRLPHQRMLGFFKDDALTKVLPDAEA